MKCVIPAILGFFWLYSVPQVFAEGLPILNDSAWKDGRVLATGPKCSQPGLYREGEPVVLAVVERRPNNGTATQGVATQVEVQVVATEHAFLTQVPELGVAHAAGRHPGRPPRRATGPHS